MEDKELDASTKLEKVKKLAKNEKCDGDGTHDSMFEQYGNVECNI